MQASQRLVEIEHTYGDQVQSIVPIELDDETLRLTIYLYDGSNMRVTEQWDGTKLTRYSYYWLTEENELLIGWDNAPHHKTVATSRITNMLASKAICRLPEKRVWRM